MVRRAVVGIALGVAVVVTAVTAGAATNVLVLTAGSTGSVSCAGPSLTVTSRSATSLGVTCAPNPPTTTTAEPSTTTTTAPVQNGKWWTPPLVNQPWQWELDHPLDLLSATDMGTNDTLPSGATAPKPVIYDIDGFENPASTVSMLHAQGDRVVCYIEVGTVGNYYAASDEGQSTTYYAQLKAAADLGTKQSGWPEYYLNVNSSTTVAIEESMISECHAKGFDAIETDNDETWQYKTGFSISEANVESYMDTLIGYAHSVGLGVIVKNPDDIGNSSFSDALEPLADGAITEQCNQYSTCSDLGTFLGHKAVFNAEYSTATSSFCPADMAKGINGAKFDVNLTGVRSPCQ
jgi:hypothetical protein